MSKQLRNPYPDVEWLSKYVIGGTQRYVPDEGAFLLIPYDDEVRLVRVERIKTKKGSPRGVWTADVSGD